MNIHWLIQTAESHPALTAGQAPAGLLSAREQQHWQQLASEKRRRDWLLGRWTAKQLLQTLLREADGQEVTLAALEIENNAQGAPFGLGPAAAFSLSISHSHQRAFCAALPGAGRPLGVDIEQIAPRSAEFVQSYFTAAEAGRWQGVSAELAPLYSTAIWSAKEAVLKALGVGLTLDTQSFDCLLEPPLAAPYAWQTMTVSFNEQRFSGPPELTGWWCVRENSILTMVTG